MSTRSMIGAFSQGQIITVTCHFDGYPEGVGRTLVENYVRYPKIIELITCGGNMRSLGKTFDECDFYPYNWDDEFEIYDSMDILLRDIGRTHIEYLYLFVDGRWVVMSDQHEVNPLTEVA